MEKEPSSTQLRKPGLPSWIIAAIILLCALLAMLVLIVAAGALLLKPMGAATTRPTERSAPLAVSTVAAASAAPTATMFPSEPPAGSPALVLDFEAKPVFGSEILQRAFTPDPHSVELTAGGSTDNSEMGLHCGFTSASPTYTFSLRGGASDTFLRLYFISGDGTDTTLVIHAPDGQWLCNDNYVHGTGTAPLIEFEFGPSGEYAVWVGTHDSGSTSSGVLFITQSAQNAP